MLASDKERKLVLTYTRCPESGEIKHVIKKRISAYGTPSEIQLYLTRTLEQSSIKELFARIKKLKQKPILKVFCSTREIEKNFLNVFQIENKEEETTSEESGEEFSGWCVSEEELPKLDQQKLYEALLYAAANNHQKTLQLLLRPCAPQLQEERSGREKRVYDLWQDELAADFSYRALAYQNDILNSVTTSIERSRLKKRLREAVLLAKEDVVMVMVERVERDGGFWFQGEKLELVFIEKKYNMDDVEVSFFYNENLNIFLEILQKTVENYIKKVSLTLLKHADINNVIATLKQTCADRLKKILSLELMDKRRETIKTQYTTIQNLTEAAITAHEDLQKKLTSNSIWLPQQLMSYASNAETINELKKQNIDPNKIINPVNGNSLLHEVIEHGHIHLIPLLLISGISPHLCNNANLTAMELAIQREKKYVAYLMLADPDAYLKNQVTNGEAIIVIKKNCPYRFLTSKPSEQDKFSVIQGNNILLLKINEQYSVGFRTINQNYIQLNITEENDDILADLTQRNSNNMFIPLNLATKLEKFIHQNGGITISCEIGFKNSAGTYEQKVVDYTDIAAVIFSKLEKHVFKKDIDICRDENLNPVIETLVHDFSGHVSGVKTLLNEFARHTYYVFWKLDRLIMEDNKNLNLWAQKLNVIFEHLDIYTRELIKRKNISSTLWKKIFFNPVRIQETAQIYHQVSLAGNSLSLDLLTNIEVWAKTASRGPSGRSHLFDRLVILVADIKNTFKQEIQQMSNKYCTETTKKKQKQKKEIEIKTIIKNMKDERRKEKKEEREKLERHDIEIQQYKDRTLKLEQMLTEVMKAQQQPTNVNATPDLNKVTQPERDKDRERTVNLLIGQGMFKESLGL